MKKIIIIWAVVVIAVIGFGIVSKQIQKKTAPETVPTIELTYLNQDGVEETLKIPNKPVTHTVDGKTYKYNPYVWWGQPIQICGVKLHAPFSTTALKEEGFHEHRNNGGQYTIDDENVFMIQEHTSGLLTKLSVYSDLYNEYASISYKTCNDFVLPCNLQLGVATKADVEKYFGTSYTKSHTGKGDAKFVLLEYQASPNGRASGEILTLYFTPEEEILCAVTWWFDAKNPPAHAK